MIINYQGWRQVFLFSLGLFAGTAFCMKWMEKDFLYNGEVFTIIGLEISYSKEKVTALLSGMDDPVRNILRYHLYFDFAFMLGVYPGIAALCMMGRKKTGDQRFQRVLLSLAWLQGVAFGCDIMENTFLLNWVAEPDRIGSFGQYHVIVIVKWVVALAGALIAIPFAIRKKKNPQIG